MHQAYLHKTGSVVSKVQILFFVPSTKVLCRLTASPLSVQSLGIRVVCILKIMFLGNCGLKHFENEKETGGFNLEDRKGLNSLVLYHTVICRGKTRKDHLLVTDFNDHGVITIASNVL